MAAGLTLEAPSALAKFIGRELAVSDWLEITPERVRQFAEATGDRQWIHLDAPRAAAESPFGAPVAHGFLTLSLASYFLKEVLQFRGGVRLSVNYGLNRVRFPAPVVVGSRVRARFGVGAVTDSPGYVESVLSVSIETMGSEKPCCALEWIVRFYS